MTLSVFLNEVFIVSKNRKYNLMQCPKNSICNLATSTIVKLFKLFKFKLLTAAILSKIHTVHPTCPSDTDTLLHKM